MTSPEQGPSVPGETLGQELRDKAISFLPPLAWMTRVSYWPRGDEDDLELVIHYRPQDSQITIESREGINLNETSRRSGILTKCCDLDTNTGEVLVYEEDLEPVDDSINRNVWEEELYAIEENVSGFTTERQQFFLDLFDNI